MATVSSKDYREFIEEKEKEYLSPYAALSVNTRGRERPMKPCPIRTDYIRDRDRIIHCKSFRRLKHKTQVFLSPEGDHYRTRLTDLGHTPFGHAGEEVLNNLMKDEGGFAHNEQSIRVVEKLENDGRGLNLTYEVRDGILNHRRSGTPCTLEGYAVSLADRIAYINHDIDDAIRAGVLSPKDIPESCNKILGDTHGERINTMILDILEQSFGKPEISMSEPVKEQFHILRSFMFDKVYLNPRAKGEEKKGKLLVEQLFAYYLDHVDLLPHEFLMNLEEDGRKRIVADYIACMTDNYAITDYERLFVPREWSRM